MPLLEARCPYCGGNGCDACGGCGQIRVTRCPHAEGDETDWSDVARAIDAMTLIEARFLPAAGGWDDQTAAFVECVRLCSGFFAECKRERAEEEAKKATRETRGALSKRGGAPRLPVRGAK